MPLTLTTEPCTAATTGLWSSGRVGGGHVADLGRGERVEDVGQARAGRSPRAGCRRPSARRRAPPGRPPAPAPTGAPGWRPAGTASWPAARRPSRRPAARRRRRRPRRRRSRRILAGSQVTLRRTARPIGPGQDLAEQGAGQDDDQRGEHAGHARRRRSGRPPARRAGRRAPRRRGTRRWRWRRPAAPGGSRRGRRAGRARSAPGRRRTSGYPLTVMVPTCPSWTWKLHSKG